jgi:PKD repeat protein
MPTLKDVAKLLGMQSELKMAAEVGLHVPISTLALIQKYEQLPPKARFSVVPTSGTMPLAVQFTDQSLGYITKRDWNFGNGEHNGDPNPSHTYRSPEESFTGSAFELAGCLAWNPTLTVSNKAGSDTASATVTVNPAPPLAKFSATPNTGPAPLQVDFAVDRSAGYCLTHRWGFGDPASGNNNSATTSGQAGPYHKYEAPGTYNVVLEVSNTAGVSYGGATIAVTGGSSPGPGSGTDTPHIVAGRVPGYSTISVSGNKFTANAAITITVTKDQDKSLLASANAPANSEGLLASTDINVPSCTGSGYDKFVIDVQATETGGKVSNQVQIDCYTSNTP